MISEIFQTSMSLSNVAMKNIVEGKKGTSGRVECLSYVDSVHRVTDVVAETFEGGLMALLPCHWLRDYCEWFFPHESEAFILLPISISFRASSTATFSKKTDRKSRSFWTVQMLSVSLFSLGARNLVWSISVTPIRQILQPRATITLTRSFFSTVDKK